MKHTLLIATIISVFCISCEKKISKEAPLNNYLVIGTQSMDFIQSDSVISAKRGEAFLYALDLNQDSTVDFQIYLYYNYSPCVHSAEIRFDCLSPDAEVILNDSINQPAVLNYGDTLTAASNWSNGSFHMAGSHKRCEFGGGDGKYQTNGIWYKKSDKYIGLKVLKEGELYYGWINISGPDTEFVGSATVHGIDYREVALD